MAVIVAAAALLLLCGGTGARAAAVDLSIGATGGYIWWNPSWGDAKSLARFAYVNPAVDPAPRFIIHEDAGDFYPASNFMGGPMLSVGFLQRWKISSVFIIGAYTFRHKSFSDLTSLTNMGPVTRLQLTSAPFVLSRQCLKWDNDNSVAYSINGIFKVFLGFKVQGYEYDQKLTMYNFALYVRNLRDTVVGYGPALGFGVTYQLPKNFFITANFSGLVLWNIEKMDVRQSWGYDNNGAFLTPLYTPRSTTMSFGGNATANAGYFIEKINMAVTLGGRYQFLYNRQKFKNAFDSQVTFSIIERRYDHFFGITASVTYSFRIGSEKNEKKG